MHKADRPAWNKATPTPEWLEKMLPIKEVGWRLAIVRREMSQNTPNPRLALTLHNSSRPYPLNGVRKSSLESNLRPWMVLDTQFRLLAREGGERSHSCRRRLCLIRDEKAWQQFREGLETDWLQVETGWNSRELAWLCQLHFPNDVNSPRMHVALRDSWPRKSSLLI